MDLRTNRPRYPASDKQLGLLRFLVGGHGLTRQALDAWLKEKWTVVADDLDSVSCSLLIDQVKGWSNGPPEEVRQACGPLPRTQR